MSSLTVRRMIRLVLIGWWCATTATARAAVTLPAIFGDNMVLQAGRADVPVWGQADPGEKVRVQLADQAATGIANDQGEWRVTAGVPKGAGPFELTIEGTNKIVIQNVLVGEVWLCSGQSNMQMSVDNSKDAKEEIAAANWPQIRFFMVARTAAQEPQTQVKGRWVVCSPGTVGAFSAVGYYFGRELHHQLKVPVGLIGSYWGGTPAEAWTSLQAMQGKDEFATIFAKWDARFNAYPAAKAKYDADLKAWEAAMPNPKAPTTRQAATRPVPPLGPDSPYAPGRLYNAMIHPLVGFALRGAIWYQGEANAPAAYQYRTLLPTMIGDWRARWKERDPKQSDFPFGIVQLANYMARKPDPGDSTWAELREAQALTAKQPNNGLAVAIDIGEARDIHPKDKQTVGKRLALWALAKVYGHDIEYSGPVYESMTVEGDKVRLKFSHAAGLVAKGEKPVGFAVAGDDKKFAWADATIDGDSVVVSSPEVQAPVAVRYGWADNPDVNLYNQAGLPMAPFRTDQWDGITKGK